MEVEWQCAGSRWVGGCCLSSSCLLSLLADGVLLDPYHWALLVGLLAGLVTMVLSLGACRWLRVSSRWSLLLVRCFFPLVAWLSRWSLLLVSSSRWALLLAGLFLLSLLAVDSRCHWSLVIGRWSWLLSPSLFAALLALLCH